MGPQPSTLNCKINDLNEKNEVTANRDFFNKHINKKQMTEQSDKNTNNFPSENVIGNKSSPFQLTRATSEKNLSAKSSRQATKIKIFIPEHQSLTKVSQTQFKGSLKQKKFYVEDKSKSLAEIIQPRYGTMKHFPYSQILGLTESLVYGLAYMSKKSCNHHDFYPTNIYYLDGKFKVINPLEIQTSGFCLTSQRQRFSFLSPQLIIAILQEASQSDIGEDILGKADIFAIGMILLQVCCLQPSSECYDAESYNIVDSIIRQRLAKVAKVYTPIMAQCINLMLQYEIQRRIDPIILAQLIHWKVETQKLAAIQMQAPKTQSPLPQQGPIGPNMRNMMPGAQGIPPNMIPPQLRGPPSPPYSHQPFKMQNLNQNVIAVPVPNEQFTRIGPNNQGFLSSSSLQQKLRVIELIKQHPQEDEDVQYESKIEEYSEIEQNVNKNVNLTENKLIVEKQQTKPQYPLVESIYNEKPLAEGYNGYEKNPRMNVNQQPFTIPESRQFLSQPDPYLMANKVNLTQNQITPNSKPNLNVLQNQQVQQRITPSLRNEQQRTQMKYTEQRRTETFTTETNSLSNKIYELKPAKLPSNDPSVAQKVLNYDYQSKLTQPGLNYQPLSRRNEQSLPFVSSYSYGTSSNSNTVKNSPTINNIYSTDQYLSPQKSVQNESLYTKKYGTSFQTSIQGQTIDERVQRVLNMSRNAK